MNCIKCGRKSGENQVFCNDCLEKMKQNPVNPDTVINLPKRPAPSPIKKRSFRHRYFWDAEERIEVLRTRLRWTTFGWVVSFLCFLAVLAVLIWLLQWQGISEIPLPGSFSR